MITQDRLKELLSYDAELGVFVRRIARPGPNGGVGSVAGCDNGQGYIRIYADGRPYKAHRLAWLYVYGDWPTVEIDHINGDRSDNRICNLRDVVRAQNKMNSATYKNNSSGLKGVSYAKRNRKWKAQIQVGGKKRGLGYFDTKEAASAAYQQAASEGFGEFARAA